MQEKITPFKGGSSTSKSLVPSEIVWHHYLLQEIWHEVKGELIHASILDVGGQGDIYHVLQEDQYTTQVLKPVSTGDFSSFGHATNKSITILDLLHITLLSLAFKHLIRAMEYL